MGTWTPDIFSALHLFRKVAELTLNSSVHIKCKHAMAVWHLAAYNCVLMFEASKNHARSTCLSPSREFAAKFMPDFWCWQYFVELLRYFRTASSERLVLILSVLSMFYIVGAFNICPSIMLTTSYILLCKIHVDVMIINRNVSTTSLTFRHVWATR